MKSAKIRKMIYLLLFFLEIIVLFFLSRSIARVFSLFLPISALSLIFFPGVVVHELSHLLVAAIMLVKVGRIEFKPKIIDEELKRRSVEVARTDPVRRAIIGFAPVFVGLLVIFEAVHLFTTNLSFFLSNHLFNTSTQCSLNLIALNG